MLLSILNVIFIFVEVLLIFNLLILVHELGHFLAAKWRGLQIDGFGIWFGKPIWQKKIGGVVYSLGSIPAGGFVKLPQMAPMEAIEGSTEKKAAELPPISALDKIIVAFAGPLFSFGLAFVFAAIVCSVGRPVSQAESTTTIGYVVPDSPASKAGFQIGDVIEAIDGHPVTRWSGMGDDCVIWRIVRSEGKTVEIQVRRGNETLKLNPEPREPHKAHWWTRKTLRQVGIAGATTPMVAKAEPDSPAAKAGFQPNDLLLDIDGQKIYTERGIYEYIKDHPAPSYTLKVQRGAQTLSIQFTPPGVKVVGISSAQNSPARLAGLKIGDRITGIDGKQMLVSPALEDYIESHGGKQITLTVLRDDKEITLPVTPEIPQDTADPDAKPDIGADWVDDGIAFDNMGILTPTHPGPIEQLRASMMTIVNTLDAVLSPKSSIGFQHMGGPVMMMRAYYVMFDNKEGWKLALWFSVILNVNLAVLNMLPIPVLDGGHIALAIIEAVRRRPINLRILETIQSACAVVIIGFMLCIFFYDVQDLSWFGKVVQPKYPPPPSMSK